MDRAITGGTDPAARRSRPALLMQMTHDGRGATIPGVGEEHLKRSCSVQRQGRPVYGVLQEGRQNLRVAPTGAPLDERAQILGDLIAEWARRQLVQLHAPTRRPLGFISLDWYVALTLG